MHGLTLLQVNVKSKQLGQLAKRKQKEKKEFVLNHLKTKRGQQSG